MHRAAFGATTSTIFDTLSDGYVAQRTAEGKGKYISPDRMVDASTCLYPDYTWFIRDVAHDAYPPEINKLFMDIFHSSTQYTVFTDSKFPQFVSYNADTKKIAKITEPVAGTEAPGKNILQIIASFIASFFARLLSIFGGGKTAAT